MPKVMFDAVIYGNPGVGKTFASQIIKEALEAHGFEVTVFDNAPQVSIEVPRGVYRNRLIIEREV